MTTEIEKQFFETFGIGKVKRRCCSLDSETHCPTDYITCEDCSYWIKTEDELDKYPEITDRKLLQLICIVVELEYLHVINVNSTTDIDTLKEIVLHSLFIRSYKNAKLKQQVKALFEDKEQ